MSSIAELRDVARGMRNGSVVTRAAIERLQEIIADVFREHADAGCPCGDECDTLPMLTELFAAVTEEGRLWGEYMWLLLTLKRIGVSIPPEETGKAAQVCVDLLSELSQ